MAVNDLATQGARASAAMYTMQITGTCNDLDSIRLTQCGLMTPYGDKDLGQPWLR